MKDSDGKEILTISEEGFYEDPRYKQCNKEALYGVVLGLANLVWWFVFGYGLGDKPVDDYSYILGFPSWFFMSSIAGAIVFTILTFILVNKKMEIMSLEKFSKEEAEQYVIDKRNEGK